MGRGEQVARLYVAAVLLGQVAVATASGMLHPGGLAVQVISAACLALPLVASEPGALLRLLSSLPAIGVSVYWATVGFPLWTIAWLSWACITAWLTIPAGRGQTATLAERYHPRLTGRGAHAGPGNG